MDDITFLLPWGKTKATLDELCGVTAWTLHDIRRIFRTNLGRLGVVPHIAERVVNHVSARSDMERTYDLHRYLPEMRDAIEKWEAHLTAPSCSDLGSRWCTMNILRLRYDSRYCWAVC